MRNNGWKITIPFEAKGAVKELNHLAHSIIKNENGSKIRYMETSEATKRELGEHFELPQLSPALTQWYRDLPKSKDIMFYWTNDFYIIGMDNLLVALEGYRFIREGESWIDLSETMKWNSNWVVISSWNGNPVIADISKVETPIYCDYVGGEFSPKLLVDSLEKFDYFLAVWLNNHDDRYYKSGEYQSDYFEFIEKEWNHKLSQDEIENLCEFLPIAKSTENFKPIEQRIESKAKKYYVYLDDAGEHKSKVMVAVKKETGLSFDEIRNGLHRKGLLIAEGYGENTLHLADYFISLGAKIRMEQK